MELAFFVYQRNHNSIYLNTVRHVLYIRSGAVFEQPHHRHDHAGGAETALRSVPLVEPLLDRVQLSSAAAGGAADPLHRGDPGPVEGEEPGGAGGDDVVVDRWRPRPLAVGDCGNQDGAGAADALATHQLGAGQTQAAEVGHQGQVRARRRNIMTDIWTC